MYAQLALFGQRSIFELMTPSSNASPRKLRLALVACASKKLDHPAKAKDLYMNSHLFRLSRAYVEALMAEGEIDGWFILSAKHGLLDPEAEIAPYDTTLMDLTPDERLIWGSKVVHQLKGLNPAHLTFFAGRAYRSAVIPGMENEGVTHETPLAGLGIGQQKAWLMRHIKE